MPPPISQATRVRLIRDAQTGLFTLHSLKEKYHLNSLALISKILVTAGVSIVAAKQKVRAKREEEERLERRVAQHDLQAEKDKPIVEAAQTGMYSVANLAERFSYSTTGIRNVLHRGNVDISQVRAQREEYIQRLFNVLLYPSQRVVDLLQEQYQQRVQSDRYYTLAERSHAELNLWKGFTIDQLARLFEARASGFTYSDCLRYASDGALEFSPTLAYSSVRYVLRKMDPALQPSNI